MPVKTVGEERMSNKTDLASLTGCRTRSSDQESGPIDNEAIIPTKRHSSEQIISKPREGEVPRAKFIIVKLFVNAQTNFAESNFSAWLVTYSPQYGSAKDPINMAGFVASGMLRGERPQIDIEAILGAPPGEQLFALDVRAYQGFASGHIPGAVNIPLDELHSRRNELPRDQMIAAYYQFGQRGYLATRILLQAGFSAVNVSGGYQAYRLFTSERDMTPD
ncbi:rhodanese-like domain-containing protein [Gimesia sp.]|uniref:rhodanese-like domain-containing protein n=1 Tax=Gimesia sp. TaxID=2024833 RepID=UPI003A92BAF0